MGFYDKTYKVNVWVNLSNSENTDALIDMLQEDGAEYVPWIASTFKDTLMELKGKGWHHAFEADQAGNITLDPQLLHIGMITHLKKYNEQAVLTGESTMPAHYLDRSIKSDVDYERICNELLATYDSKVLSYALQIQRRVDLNGAQVFVSDGYVPGDIVGKLTNCLLVYSEDTLISQPPEDVYGFLQEDIIQKLNQINNK